MLAATPERIVSAKRFMGKLEKLYKVSPFSDTRSVCCPILKLVADGFGLPRMSCAQAHSPF